MTIQIPAYTLPARVNAVQPYVYSDGENAMLILEDIRAKLISVVKEANEGFAQNNEFFADEVNSLIDRVNTAIAQGNEATGAQIAEVLATAEQWMEVTIENNDAITSTIFSDKNTSSWQTAAREFGVQVPTVADMLSLDVSHGTIVITQGYHAVGDGGACSYVAILSAVESYDIAATGRAYRPVVTGTIHPKMFGTFNDGVQPDNFGLQRCYDYAGDAGIEHIDGTGLTYTIGTVNPYDVPYRGWAHTGALMPAGRTLSNATFRVKDGASNGTVALSVKIDAYAGVTTLRNVKLDGNRANVATIPELGGREDGGMHCLHILDPNHVYGTSTPGDFAASGDFLFDNVEFIKPLSYGSYLNPIDAKIELRACDWDVNGIAFLAYSTTFEVAGGKVKSGIARAGMYNDIFHDEIELGAAYTGGKRKRIHIHDVEVDYRGTINGALFRIQHFPQQGVNYESIVVENIKSVGDSLRGVYIYHHGTAQALDITSMTIRNAALSGGPMLFSIPTNPNWVAIGTLLIDANGRVCTLEMTRTKVGTGKIVSPKFGEAHRLILPGTRFDSLRIIDADVSNLGTSGIIRDNNTHVDDMEIIGGNFRDSGVHPYFIEAVMKKVTMRDGVVHGDIDGKIGTLISDQHSTPDITIRNMDIRATAFRVDGFTIHARLATDGVIHINNVRARTGNLNATINAATLPAARKIITNSANLY